MSRRHDVRRAKQHLSYSVAEICETFRVGPTAVWRWRKAGLTPIEDRRPYLFHGSELARFLTARNKPRQPSGPGEIFCVACKRTISPLGNVASLMPLSGVTGNLIGKCPHCRRDCYRRVTLAEIAAKAGTLTIYYEDGSAPFSEDGDPPRIVVFEDGGK